MTAMKITPRSTITKTLLAALSVSGLLTVSACATEDTADSAQNDQTSPPVNTATATEETTGANNDNNNDNDNPDLTATVNNADGADLGTVEFMESDGVMRVDVELSGLEPGFYGLHVHQIGECETDSAAPDDPENTGDFLSAGSHLGSDEADHPDHAGDLPQLLVQESGDAVLSFETDRLTLADLEDDDGSALMIHSNPDNFANVPDRYAPEGVDQDTLNTGDAGSRLACGVIGG